MFFVPFELWPKLLSGLKLRPCPHCRKPGSLNAHGFLRGYGLGSSRIIRGKRIFCSNRGRRKGCGRTHSLFLPNIIPTFSILAILLWSFLFLVLSGKSRRQAFRNTFPFKNISRAYSLWKRCLQSQINLRLALSTLCQPPLSTQVNPWLQVLEHLQLAFSHSPCPIGDFQTTTQLAFL